jgi:hypothetical protein
MKGCLQVVPRVAGLAISGTSLFISIRFLV